MKDYPLRKGEQLKSHDHAARSLLGKEILARLNYARLSQMVERDESERKIKRIL